MSLHSDLFTFEQCKSKMSAIIINGMFYDVNGSFNEINGILFCFIQKYFVPLSIIDLKQYVFKVYY
jgi:hypothetical protein